MIKIRTARRLTLHSRSATRYKQNQVNSIVAPFVFERGRKGELMDNYKCWLVTVLYLENNSLLKCAIKYERGLLTQEEEELCMEPEFREKFHALLPLHVRECGPIVDIEPIFEVVEIGNDEGG